MLQICNFLVFSKVKWYKPIKFKLSIKDYIDVKYDIYLQKRIQEVKKTESLA